MELIKLLGTLKCGIEGVIVNRHSAYMLMSPCHKTAT